MDAVSASLSQVCLAAETSASATASATEPSVLDIVFPLTLLLLLAVMVPVAFMGLNALISRVAHGRHNLNPAKQEPYEAGLSATVGDAAGRFDVKFYLVAMIFLVFDVAVALLYPWAVHFAKGGWGMVVLLLVFLALLETGYLYLSKKGAFDWER